MRDEFSTLNIESALGIKLERLRGWMKAGFIRPTHKSRGQGRPATFTRADVYRIALFEQLISAGFKREMAADCVNNTVKEKDVKQLRHITFTYEATSNKIIFGKFAIRSAMLNLERGVFEDGKTNRPLHKPINWNHIHVVNFDLIKTMVDNSLAVLPER
jgi:hypothetical protein